MVNNERYDKLTTIPRNSIDNDIVNDVILINFSALIMLIEIEISIKTISIKTPCFSH